MYNRDFEWLERDFPKSRQKLPLEYEKLYVDEYKRNRDPLESSLNLKQRLEQWMHRQVANVSSPEGATLEIGAGTLNHIQWEKRADAYDIIEPFTALFQGKLELEGIRNIYHSISDVPMQLEYTKILSVAVLEHILDLPTVIARSALLLSDRGVMVNGIPSEGGLLWYLAWRLTTGVSFRLRTGLSYAKLMTYEHVNNATEILKIIQFFFNDVNYSRFPLPWLHGSFYTFVEARSPNKIRAHQFLDRRK